MAIESRIWIYWGFCLIAAAIVIRCKGWVTTLLSPHAGSLAKWDGYQTSIALGWIVTLLTALTYALLTRKYATGPYQLADLVAFSILNGVLEQFMFVFWFLLGCYAVKVSVPGKPMMTFAVGYVAYVVYSGLVHVSFWVSVLPPHKPVTLIMVGLLSATSLAWMWLFWRYRAMGTIIAMHIVVDMLMIGHLHSTWFEDYQWL